MHRLRRTRESETTSETPLEFDAKSEFNDLGTFIDYAVKATVETGADLSESGNYEKSKELCEEVLKGLVKLRNDFGPELQMLNNWTGGEDEDELVRKLDAFKAVSELNPSTNWSKESVMKEYNELTWECGPGYNNKTPYPAIDNENDGFTMQSRDSLICPISQCVLVDPVINQSGCKHSYSKASIEQVFMHSGNGSISCPVSGCRSTLSRRGLVSNDALKLKLKRMEERVFPAPTK